MHKEHEKYYFRYFGEKQYKYMYDFGEGEVKGFKLKGSNSAIFATLSKGGFEVGDQVVFAVTKNSDANKWLSTQPKIRIMFLNWLSLM